VEFKMKYDSDSRLIYFHGRERDPQGAIQREPPTILSSLTDYGQSVDAYETRFFRSAEPQVLIILHYTQSGEIIPKYPEIYTQYTVQPPYSLESTLVNTTHYLLKETLDRVNTLRFCQSEDRIYIL